MTGIKHKGPQVRKSFFPGAISFLTLCRLMVNGHNRITGAVDFLIYINAYAVYDMVWSSVDHNTFYIWKCL